MYFYSLTFTVLVWVLVASAQPADKVFNETAQKFVTEKISRLLEDNYIHKDIAQACAAYLESEEASERYALISHPRAFVRQLNEDLLNIHKDRHIRIQFIPPEGREVELQNPILFFLLRTYERRKANYGIREVKIFSGNIGYLDIRLFEPLDMVHDKLLHTFNILNDVDALIIDLRNNSGGNPATVQFICSWFFDKAVHLNSIYWRRGEYTEEFWTIDSLGLPKKPTLPLFILTSSKTFSAGEEFAYDLQVQKRATLIGEKTAGGANPGYTFSISEQFSIFIPTGRSLNPLSGENWEGVGIQPDIAVRSAKALEVALEKAQTAGRNYRQKQDEKIIASYMDFSIMLKNAGNYFEAGQPDTAEATLYEALDSLLKKGSIGEWAINDLGYRFMGEKDQKMATALFQYNTIKFPQSANAWDSLGEIYYTSGNLELGTEAYEKSLWLNPQNQNARIMLGKIRLKSDEHIQNIQHRN
jgi:tetratricopeptide (TPR) repeat protein